MAIYVASRKLDVADFRAFAAISTCNVLRVEISSSEAWAKAREWDSLLRRLGGVGDLGGHKNKPLKHRTVIVSIVNTVLVLRFTTGVAQFVRVEDPRFAKPSNRGAPRSCGVVGLGSCTAESYGGDYGGKQALGHPATPIQCKAATENVRAPTARNAPHKWSAAA